MDQIKRILLLHRMFKANRYGLTMVRMMRATGGASRSTIERDLVYLRDALEAPLEDDGKTPKRWFYAPESRVGFELPGVWLTADDMFALQMMQLLLERSGAGLLGREMKGLQARIDRMLGDKRLALGKVRVIRVQARPVDDAVFRVIAESTLDGKQVNFTYCARTTNQITQRTLSPQRLTHHRDNWYLEAFDEIAKGLRCFSVDRITEPHLLDDAAREIPFDELDRHLGAGFGIFSGEVRGIAILHFSAFAARWVADESLHPLKELQVLDDGRLEVRLPYADPRELMKDIMSYAGEVEVVGPPELVDLVRERICRAAGLNGVALAAA